MTSPLAARRSALRLAAAVLAAAGPLALLAVPAPASAVAASAGPTTATTATTATTIAAGTTATASHDRTSAREARRVDRVPAPTFVWRPCRAADRPVPKSARCATIRVPLDYDTPKGPTTTLGVARIRAAKPAQRIGVLFVNPGGPGGSATDLLFDAPDFLDQRILDRFDIVGVDPRGVGRSAQLRCFPTEAARAKAAAGYETDLPLTRAETRAFMASSRTIAKACSTTGRRLASHMSTAEVARDMDVVRRALGDTKLTYLGFSYGTQLGQVYANLFPDRVRAIVLDGVIDPVAWTTGRRGSGAIGVIDDRIRSADASYAALRELLRRCDRLGRPTCAFAGTGDSMAKFDRLARRLKARPVVLSFGGEKITYTYRNTISGLLEALYETNLDGPRVTGVLQELWEASEPTSTATRRVAPVRSVLRMASARPRVSVVAYDNGDESFLGVTCSDGRSARDPRTWLTASAAAERRAPYFGAIWSLSSAPCAGSTWKAHDEDRYLGPFTRRTAAPVLVVGNYWDPATSYRYGAVPASRTLPNSRLLTSDSWGHTAYGTSACLSNAVGAYLIKGTLPPKGTICHGPQPFPATAGTAGAAGRTATTGPATAEDASTARPAPITPWPLRTRS